MPKGIPTKRWSSIADDIEKGLSVKKIAWKWKVSASDVYYIKNKFFETVLRRKSVDHPDQLKLF